MTVKQMIEMLQRLPESVQDKEIEIHDIEDADKFSIYENIVEVNVARDTVQINVQRVW